MRIVAMILSVAMSAGAVDAATAKIVGSSKKAAAPSTGVSGWTYSIVFSGVPSSATKLSFSIPLPASVWIKYSEDFKVGVNGSNYTFNRSLKAATDKSKLREEKLNFSVYGKDIEVEAAALSWEATVDTVESGGTNVNTHTVSNEVSGPKSRLGGRYSLVTGLVGSLHLDDHESWIEEESHLTLKNKSMWRATVLAGVHVAFEKRRAWLLDGMIVSIAKSVDTSDLLVDGISIGLTRNVSSNLRLTVGYTLRRGDEIRRGYRRNATNFVKAQQADSASTKYDNIALNADMSDLLDIKDYDNFPLADGSGAKFHESGAVGESFNSSFFIGVTVPVSISGALGIK